MAHDAAAVDDAPRELLRVVDRLRTMPLTKLAAPWVEFPSRAAGARALAQELADRGAEAVGIERHVVPDVGDAAVGDQVAVTGRDYMNLGPLANLDWLAERLREFRLAL